MSTFDDALRLIATTPGYVETAQNLAQMRDDGKIHFDGALEDRGQAHLGGSISLGSEALDGHPLSLAETLVHEAFHQTQNPLQKTGSFWAGVLTGTDTMRRYEQPAYEAAIAFLNAAMTAHPDLADFAQSEIESIHETFAANYGGSLNDAVA